MDKQKRIKDELNSYKNELKPLLRQSGLYSWLRIFCVVAALVLAIYADQSKRSFGFVLALLFLLLFLLLVLKHNELKHNIRKVEAKLIVKQRLLARFENDWHMEPCDSSCPENDSVSYDLDLLGADSLYAFLNFCATSFGKKRLQALLSKDNSDIDEIKRRQAAVKELLKHEDFLLAFESGSVLFAQDARQLKEQDLETLIAYGEKQEQLFPQWFAWFSMICAVLCVVSLTAAIFHLLPFGYGAVLLLFNLIVSFIINGKSHNELVLSKDMARILKDYDILFECVADSQLNSDLLCELQQTMREAKQSMKQFHRILDVILMRCNVISYFILSALVQFDVVCVRLLENWRAQCGVQMKAWLLAVGEMEALVSLSVVAQVKETWCFPELLDQEAPLYEISEGYHPLLMENKAVPNSLQIQNSTLIITGSNMSGKTTFLRTLGIAVMMAKAGAPVCAKQMRITPLQVYTSMRVRDDVKEGISTFYAELLRIRQMMDAAKGKKQMLVLIDEIFKGTNSADRLLCAKTAIARLHLPHIITIVSTHDFELCDLQQDADIQAINAHFAEYYQNDEIRFDYKLKEGRCTSTNAKELMRLAGIV